MPETYVIREAREAGLKDNPHGGQLKKWYWDLEDASGNVTKNVYCQKSPSFDATPGTEVYGDLDPDGQYGPRLHPKEAPNASQSSPQAASRPQTPAGGGNQPVASSGPQNGSHDERQMMIVHQHSQTAAVEIVRLAGNYSGKPAEEITDQVKAVARSLTADVLEAAKP